MDRMASALAELEPIYLKPAGRRAAVACMLRERKEGLELLAIKRADKANDPWSGHMALPGGGQEPKDKDAYDTVRREVLEEVGIDIEEGCLLGRLDDLSPRRNPREMVVSCFVVAIDAEPVQLDEEEVAEAFWIPVEHLVNEEVEIPGFPGSWPAFTYRDRYVIWGLTHRILIQLWSLIQHT